MSALALMTVLSAALGAAAPALLPKAYTHWAAVLLFFVFGARSLYDGLAGGGGELDKEMAEVERELADRSAAGARQRSPTRGGAAAAPAPSPWATAAATAAALLPPVVLEAFTLTFVAEWGDRSQLATIGLAASANPVGVTLGGIAGHAICTGAAVVGGRHLAAHINEATVQVVGGALFLLFGVLAAWAGP